MIQLSNRYRIEYFLLTLVLVTSVLQLFLIPFGGSHIPLNLVLSVLFSLCSLRIKSRKIWLPVFYLTLSVIIHILYLGISPDLALGLIRIVYLIEFIVLILAFNSYFLEYQIFPSLAFRLLCFVIIFQSALVIAFRLSPFIEASFFKSSIARLFIQPNAIESIYNASLLGGNILSKEKSGGVFLNGNVSAAFSGISMFIIMGFYSLKKDLSYFIAICFCVLAILFSGSKAALFICFVLQLFFYGQWRKINGKKIKASQVLLFTIVGSFAVFIPLFLTLGSGFIVGLGWTSSARFVLWYIGVMEFIKDPLVGHGFGGWSEMVGTQVGYSAWFRNPLPPHNNVLLIWSEVGLVGLTLTFMYLTTLIVQLRKSWKMSLIEKKYMILSICVYYALLWLVIHGFITNLSLFGEPHMIPIIAFSISFWYSFVHNKLLIKENKV